MPQRVFRVHMWLIALLLAGHLFISGIYLTVGRVHLVGVSDKLNFVVESSVPNFFSAAALLLVAAASATIAWVSSVRRSHLSSCWLMSTAVLVFLAFDEGAGIHDLLAAPVQKALNGHGLLFIGWVVPYAVLTLVVAYKLLPLVRSLSTGTSKRLVGAAGLYVVAALGVEMLEAVLMDRSTQGELGTVNFDAINHTPKMILLVTIEELLEMISVALALRALLIHLAQELHVTLFDADAITHPEPKAAVGQPSPGVALATAGTIYPVVLVE